MKLRSADTNTSWCAANKEKMEEWKAKHDAMKDQLMVDHEYACAKLEDVQYLQGDIELWIATAAEMRCDYEETAH